MGYPCNLLPIRNIPEHNYESMTYPCNLLLIYSSRNFPEHYHGISLQPATRLGISHNIIWNITQHLLPGIFLQPATLLGISHKIIWNIPQHLRPGIFLQSVSQLGIFRQPAPNHEVLVLLFLQFWLK